MKNIAGFVCFVIIFPAVCSSIWGQDTEKKNEFPYTLSVTNGAGFLYGQAEEIVYEAEDIFLSQLLWDIKPLFYYEAAVEFSRRDLYEKVGFFADFSLKLGFPGVSGGMEDRDWLRADNALTHFSYSDNYTDGAMFFDFSLGVSIPLDSVVMFKLYAGLSWMHFKWTGRDGYAQYAGKTGTDYNIWDESLPQIPFSGPVIGYSQDWLFFYPGISLSIPVVKWFSTNLFFNLGPFAFGADRDDHFLTNTEYNDYVRWSLYLEPGGALLFTLSENFEITLHASYRCIGVNHGDTYERKTGSNKSGDYLLWPDSAGMAFRAVNAGLLFTVRFL
ncbi:MAG: omptin family outer membrane protease [Treponema sp.]|jgi:plasminogen activator|nr:omptin family outer membrane protease [Treponema sp.]